MSAELIVGFSIQRYISGEANPETIVAAANARQSIASNPGIAMASGPQLISNSAPTLLNLNNITQEGYAYLLNKDPTNYVQLGWLEEIEEEEVFLPALRLRPLWAYPGSGLEPTRIWYALANAAPCWIDYRIFEY